MQRVVVMLLLAGSASAQSKAPVELIKSDSSRRLTAMPNARPSVGFYRNPKDPVDVRRSTLDNMPVKMPDTSVIYTMPQLPYESLPSKEELIIPHKKKKKP